MTLENKYCGNGKAVYKKVLQDKKKIKMLYKRLYTGRG